MNIYFIAALGAYLCVLLVIGIIDMKHINGWTDYAVAGKNQSLLSVSMTLLATIIGASSTIGITDTVYRIGFPAVWWLTFGSIGLIMQSLLISEKVRSVEADTLPDLAAKIVSPSAEKLLAFIIVISWIGVVAGQLAAIDGIITFALGHKSPILFAIVTAIVILYTCIGGQLSVVRTDRLQLAVIFIGVASLCAYLYCARSGANKEIIQNIELFNSDYRFSDWIVQLFVIGGVYFIGPDIMSRNFISKDQKTARNSSLITGAVFLIFAIMITMVGMWIKYNISSETLGNNKALMYIAGNVPILIGAVLIFGLMSAVLSSTDTCLINASGIFVKDMLHKDSIALVRITVCVIGVTAYAITSLGRGDIIGLLTAAYSIYTPGVIFPLTVAVMSYNSRQINKKIWFAAVCTGGIFGLAGSVFSKALISVGMPQAAIKYLPLVGMGLSLAIAIISVRKKINKN